MLKFVLIKPWRFLIIVFLAVLFLLGIVFFSVAGREKEILIDGEFEIKEGSSAGNVWEKMEREGFVDNAWTARYYGWKTGASNNLKSGIYELKKGESLRRAIERFVAGGVGEEELVITYPEGFTLQQIAVRTAASGIGEKDDFVSSAKPDNFVVRFPVLANIPSGRDLEGYLFPDTYRVFADDKPRDVITRMVGNFVDKFSEELRQEALEGGRSLDEIVIMASIVEREVVSDEDMALVSGVLWKRLDDGAGLDADATVRYALDKWDRPLTATDLASESAYNTRRWKGLPPGPISNPSLRAIVAAVRPKKSDYYYYLSTPEGETVFSKTLDEHNANKAKYLR